MRKLEELHISIDADREQRELVNSAIRDYNSLIEKIDLETSLLIKFIKRACIFGKEINLTDWQLKILEDMRENLINLKEYNGEKV